MRASLSKRLKMSAEPLNRNVVKTVWTMISLVANMQSLAKLTERTVSVKDYLAHTSGPFRERADERLRTYRLKEEVIKELRKHADKLFIVVFSAEWCLKDCAPNVPVLSLLAEKTGIGVRVFGGLMKDPLNPRERWRIPPSPPEVRDFKVEKVPTIFVFNKNGEELGKIIENPSAGKTLEEDILDFARKT